jgi:hypothetical protein
MTSLLLPYSFVDLGRFALVDARLAPNHTADLLFAYDSLYLSAQVQVPDYQDLMKYRESLFDCCNGSDNVTRAGSKPYAWFEFGTLMERKPNCITTVRVLTSCFLVNPTCWTLFSYIKSSARDFFNLSFYRVPTFWLTWFVLISLLMSFISGALSWPSFMMPQFLLKLSKIVSFTTDHTKRILELSSGSQRCE